MGSILPERALWRFQPQLRYSVFVRTFTPKESLSPPRSSQMLGVASGGQSTIQRGKAV